MVCSAQRLLLVLVLLGLLAVPPGKVYGLRNIDLVLIRHGQEQHGVATRSLKAAEMKEMSTEKKLPAPPNNKFDPNQSSKRPVGRGSDPIHNRT
ncbi:hypothetical protein PTKIN_Ptkin17bG0156700 [Pterospermum kingtungense]